MRKPVASFRSSKFSQAAVVALMSAAMAGCSSDVSRFGDVAGLAGSTDNQRSIMNGTAQTDTVQTGSIGAAPAPVQRTFLPPPTAPAAQSYAPPAVAPVQTPRVAAAPSYGAGVAPVNQPAPGWQVGPNAVVLQQGETVDTLSHRYGVPAHAILQANNIADGSRVQPGTRIVIPTYSMPAPTAAAPARPAPIPVASARPAPAASARPAPAPISPRAAAAPIAAAPITARPAPLAASPAPKAAAHVVKSGETLDRIAAGYGVTKAQLRQANGLKSDTIRPGQRLTLPANARLAQASVQPSQAAPTPARAPAPAPVQAVAPAPAPAPAAPAKEIKTASLGNTPVAPAQPESIAIAKEPPPEAESTRGEAKSGTPSFRWPVRGRVIKEFGQQNGERNDGINLAVPEGTSIKAAEDGEVIYSGNELKGYGNLVLVRHQDGWVTAYAHASELLVNRGEKVTRGQIIARAGATGGVSQPQLHFEIRKGQRPVDPKQYLASN